MTDPIQAASGYLLSPKAADVIVSAWAPTVEDCLAQAVRGLVSCFAEVRPLRPQRIVGVICDPAPDSQLLVELLEEVIYLVDVHDAVPVQVAVARSGEGGLICEFGVAARSDVGLIGPVPKAVARTEPRLERVDSTWRCEVVISV